MAPNHSCNHVTLLEKVRLKALGKCGEIRQQVSEAAEIVYAGKMITMRHCIRLTTPFCYTRSIPDVPTGSRMAGVFPVTATKATETAP